MAMETSKEAVDRIKKVIWDKRNAASYDEKWAGSDLERARLKGITQGIETAYYLI
jgi:hypothetical protein